MHSSSIRITVQRAQTSFINQYFSTGPNYIKLDEAYQTYLFWKHHDRRPENRLTDFISFNNSITYGRGWYNLALFLQYWVRSSVLYKNLGVVLIVVKLSMKKNSSYSALVPTESRCDITTFFKSYSSEILEISFPLANPVEKLAILFRSRKDSSCRLIPRKLTVHNFIAATWLIIFGQEHYHSFWINYAISTRLGCLNFRSHPYGYKFYLIFYFFGFAVSIGKWVFISLPVTVGEFDDIMPWSVSKIIQIKCRDKLHAVKCLEPDNRVQGDTPTNINWLLYCTKSSISLLLPTCET